MLVNKGNLLKCDQSKESLSTVALSLLDLNLTESIHSTFKVSPKC